MKRSKNSYYYFPLAKNKAQLDKVFSEEVGVNMLFEFSSIAYEYCKMDEFVGFMPDFACALLCLSVYRDSPDIRELIDDAIVTANNWIRIRRSFEK